MFRPRLRSKKPHASHNVQPTYSPTFARPLLQILEYNQSPDDLRQKPRQLALQGQTDVYISRAELDLKKAIQSLAFVTHGRINSFSTLTALSLPGTTTALFWAIHALLQHQYQKPDLENPIHRRNHDARLLFQQLAKLDLDHWYMNSVDMVSPEAIPAGIQFPAGTPIAGQMYRQHPCQPKSHFYYPVTSYFSLLFADREQALLDLLQELGAVKVVITAPVNQDSSASPSMSQPKVLVYPKQARYIKKPIEPQKHPWLAYEPTWQSMVHERLNMSIAATQFNFDLDVMGLLRDQIQTIVQLMPELDSMMLPANYEDVLLAQVLQTRRVEVEFSH
ncbi:MAG: hypothetical protein AAGE59_04800 [Cyanobacteria bacterium P01_F01_bin.86]